MENYTDNLSVNERLRLTYRGIQFQATLGASTNMNQTWYTQKGDAVAKSTQAARNSQTWSNAATAEFTWNWLLTGISVTANANYRWYNGYTTPQNPQLVWNANVSVPLFKRQATLSLRAYDLLDQAKNLQVAMTDNYYQETLNNTLGRYVMLSFTWRFGSFGGRGGRGGGNFRPGAGGPPMGGGGFGGRRF